MSSSIYKKSAQKNSRSKKAKPAPVEESAREELTELQRAFRESNAKARARLRTMTDTEFWCAFCFPDRETKERFLREFGLKPLGDKYLNGVKAGEILRKERR